MRNITITIPHSELMRSSYILQMKLHCVESRGKSVVKSSKPKFKMLVRLNVTVFTFPKNYITPKTFHVTTLQSLVAFSFFSSCGHNVGLEISLGVHAVQPLKITWNYMT